MLTCLLKWNWYIICHHPSPQPDTTMSPPLLTNIMVYNCNRDSDTNTIVMSMFISYQQVNYFIATIIKKKSYFTKQIIPISDRQPSFCTKLLNLSNYAISIFVGRQLACFKLTLKPLFCYQIINIKVNLISHLQMSKLRHIK